MTSSSSSVTPQQLQAHGAQCSLCGQGFSPANPPHISKVSDKTYHGEEVELAICKIPPYVEAHKHTMELSIFYQSIGNGKFKTIMNKDFD